ncbi:MAG TPA: polysaccharide biosynthesis/export family protein, partial [Verrucomicrobiae bacterium]|nr:polysaccharide biosynthesis/export family protein [Verrucomicrobiae bacterium]
MNEQTDSNLNPGKANGAPGAAAGRNGSAVPAPVDFWLFAETLLRRWRWPAMSGGVLAAVGLLFGLVHWHSTYTAPAQLISYNAPSATALFGQREVSGQTLVGVLRSPELLQAAGAEARPPVSAAALAGCLNIMPDHNSDIIVAAVTDKTPQRALELANLYARNAVAFTQKMQAQSAAEMDEFFSRQLTNTDTQIAALDRQAGTLPAPASETNGVAPAGPLIEQLQTAQGELAALLAKYTDAHPLVQAKRAEIAALQKELAPGTPETTANPSAFAAGSGEEDPTVVRGKLEALEKTRLGLLNQQQAVRAFEANPPGFCRLLAPAILKDVVAHSRRAKVFAVCMLAGLLGVAGGVAVVLLVEIADDRLKTASDVRRVARLPVVAAGGDLNRLSETERYDWAFRTWTRLQGRLSPSPNHGLVLGITSADRGEGRSTWVQLLAEAASLLGFRVLTIATRPSPQDWGARKEMVEGAPGKSTAGIANSNFESPDISMVPAPGSNILATPAEVTEKLTGPNSQPVVHIPLPGWVWNLERRKQWQDALKHWAQIDNIVILVELPPASTPEAVLLAENLPNVVWLTASGQVTAAMTSEQLETLRHARCHLAGAVLNRAPEPFLRKRFCRWLNGAALLIALNLSILHAANNPGLPASTNQIAETNLSATVVPPDQRADWQRHFTLGAGDVLNFSLYGEPTLTELNVPIGPDGRVSYLEAQDVMAAGLTIDELRAKLDEELAKYRRAPRTIITPVAFNSKKYFLLGSVVHAGAFQLDRPTTIVEAIARARGFETVVQERDLIELADLPRTFLVRHGRRVPVDFEKLFLQGDLSQNISLAPGDYLFIPPADLKQVYIVGEV